jgi:hypothetical protein
MIFQIKYEQQMYVLYLACMHAYIMVRGEGKCIYSDNRIFHIPAELM